MDIQINGNRPWDIQINNPQFYQRIISGGSLALGESYMDGWWDCRALDEFFKRILESRLDKKVKSLKPAALWEIFKARLMNVQSKTRAFIIGQRHYDIGNTLFKIMLDKGLNYSCGYWHYADNLDEAQTGKLDLICRKIGLKPGMAVLDIGCGWGGFAKYAAETYGVKVKGITVSKEQAVITSYSIHYTKLYDFMAMDQILRATLPMTVYSGSMPLEKKYDRLGPKLSMGMPLER